MSELEWPVSKQALRDADVVEVEIGNRRYNMHISGLSEGLKHDGIEPYIKGRVEFHEGLKPEITKEVSPHEVVKVLK